MRIAAAIVAIFCARFITDAWFYAGRDGDLVWQHVLGSYVLHAHHLPQRLGHETFTAPAARWIPQEWAFSVAVAWLTSTRHFAYLAMLTTAAAAGSLLLTAYRSRLRGASTFANVLCTAFTGFAMLQAFGVRAQIFGWLFLSVAMLLLDLETDWIFLVIPVVALWANVHASALIAPVFVAAWAFGTLIEDRARTARVERNFILAAGCAFAVCLTPLLWNLPLYAIQLQTGAMRTAISEWQPPDLMFPCYIWGVLPLIGICCYFGIAAPRMRWRDGMLFAVAAFIAALAVRHLPIAALVIAPMAAQRLSSAFPSHARINVLLREQFAQTLVLASSAFVCCFIVFDLVHVPEVSGVTLPRAAVATLAKVPGTHNLYCEDFGWCSVALERPNLRTFVDGRCDAFPKNVWNDYVAVERVSPAWPRVLARWKVDSVLVDKNNALAQAIALSRDWYLFYHDERYEIFLRQRPGVSQRG
jgi:hypothetical protein